MQCIGDKSSYQDLITMHGVVISTMRVSSADNLRDWANFNHNALLPAYLHKLGVLYQRETKHADQHNIHLTDV